MAGLHPLDDVSNFVDAEGPEFGDTGEHQAVRQVFPLGVEGGADVGVDGMRDFAEALNSGKIVYSIHGVPSFLSGWSDGGDLRDCDADQAVLGDDFLQLFLAPAFGACGTLR